MNKHTSIHFPTTYQESRSYFREQLKKVKKIWPTAVLDKHFISETEDLSIDWITAEPIKKKEKLVMITTGLHGVEGFVGAAMLDLFVKQFMGKLDPNTTALKLVHALNPWGMANFRRFNRNNVDLNRNFMVDQGDFSVEFNNAYLKLDHVLNPSHPLKSFWLEDIQFMKNVIVSLAKYGIKSLRSAIMLGQQSNPAGLYFTGRETQPEAEWLQKLIKEVFSSYESILFIDMHTGYGPSHQMSLVNSPAERRKPGQLMEDFQYPLIVQADADQFYSMKGDMVNWIYHLKDSNFPNVNYYGTAFEFGTYGEGTLQETRSLRTMIYINQADQMGTSTSNVESRIHNEFVEMFYPTPGKWRDKALADCEQAFSGVLSAEGYI